MKLLDRGKFTSAENPYTDRPHLIGYGVTISAPHMVCKTFENLSNHESMLDV